MPERRARRLPNSRWRDGTPSAGFHCGLPRLPLRVRFRASFGYASSIPFPRRWRQIRLYCRPRPAYSNRPLLRCRPCPTTRRTRPHTCSCNSPVLSRSLTPSAARKARTKGLPRSAPASVHRWTIRSRTFPLRKSTRISQRSLPKRGGPSAMRRLRVEFRPSANVDIAAIFEYIFEASRSSAVAGRFIRRIRVRSLASFGSGNLARA